MGTEATRVASYDPWVGLYWLTTGRTLGGLRLTPEANTLSREEALRLYTHGSAWFSGERDVKGTLAEGQLADLAVLSEDYLSVPAERLRYLSSVLTVMGGRIVHASNGFVEHAPPLPPASPDWSPVRANPSPAERPFAAAAGTTHRCALHGHGHAAAQPAPPVQDERAFWGALGCACLAF